MDRLREILELPTSVPYSTNADARALADSASRSSRIPASVADTINALQVLHNLAQAEPDRVTPEDARRFQTYVNGMLYLMRDGDRPS